MKAGSQLLLLQIIKSITSVKLNKNKMKAECQLSMMTLAHSLQRAKLLSSGNRYPQSTILLLSNKSNSRQSP